MTTSLIYWINVLANLNTFGFAISIFSSIFLFTGFIFFSVAWVAQENKRERKKIIIKGKKLSKYFIAIFLISGLMAALIPDQNTMYKMFSINPIQQGNKK